MRRWSVFWVAAAAGIYLAGCGAAKGTAGDMNRISAEAGSDRESQTAGEVEKEAGSDTEFKPAQVPGKVNPDGQQAGGLDGNKGTSNGGKVPGEEDHILSEEELAWFDQYFNERANNGFLVTGYPSPKEMDLNEVLYNSGGIDTDPVTAEEEEAFLKECNATELITDLRHLSTGQIEGYLNNKAGIGLADVKSGLGWIYLPEYDTYYSECGDTNFSPVVCLSGEVKDGIVQVRGSMYWDVQYTFFTVKMKKGDDGYQFLSNEKSRQDSWASAEEEIFGNIKILNIAVKSYRESYSLSPEVGDDPIFDSDKRGYGIEELRNWNPQLYGVFRNEIYARHGYVFQSELWNEFFRQYKWYNGTDSKDMFSDGQFNDFEKKNLEQVKAAEGSG